MLKTVVFIDGENLRYSLMDFRRADFPQYADLFGTATSPYLQEIDVDWSAFLAHIVPNDHRLLRAYWYKCGQLSEWFKPVSTTPVARRWVSKYLNVPEAQVTIPQITTELNRAEAWYHRESERHRKILRSHTKIMLDYPNIEFRYQGILQVDPLREQRKGERGVDTALAVDMVTLTGPYDLAILVTGDIDFAPAIQVVKNSLKQVLQVAVGPRNPPFIHHAEKLRQMADSVLPVFADEIIPGMLRKRPMIATGAVPQAAPTPQN